MQFNSMPKKAHVDKIPQFSEPNLCDIELNLTRNSSNANTQSQPIEVSLK